MPKSTQQNPQKRPATPDTHPQEQPNQASLSSALPLVQRAYADPGSLTPKDVKRLQPVLGNRATVRLLGPVLQRKPLTLGSADDAAEREADSMADQVMRQLDNPNAPPATEAPPTPAARTKPATVRRTFVIRREDEVEHGPQGGAIDPQVQTEIERSRGGGTPLADGVRRQMESGFGADFGSVRVHTGGQADTLNRSLNARAFTVGNDVYFRKGEYNPGSHSGRKLLAHELTHTVQQGGVIRRKLAGVRAAVVEIAGEASNQSKAKAKIKGAASLFGLSKSGGGSGKYAQILSKLADYESLEKKLLSAKQTQLQGSEISELVKQLTELETLTVNWLAQNKEQAVDNTKAFKNLEYYLSLENTETSAIQNEGEKELKRQLNLLSNTNNNNNANDNEKIEAISDYIRNRQSSHGRRYRALKMLLPRIRHELMQVRNGQFYKTADLSDQTLDQTKSQDNAFGGQMNRLDKVTHGTQEGVFIQDRSWGLTGNVGTSMGISLVDPNAGARSVAMYELAKLLDLGVDVIAKTEFATHTSDTKTKNTPLAKPAAKMGVHMEMAKGKEAAQTPTTFTGQEAQQKGGDTISLEDPQLQRSLNALQLIDAIAGQLDRHWHNYYIATDGKGKVTGVVGIDLDMAFSPDHKTVDTPSTDRSDPMSGAHFVGMPKLVDSGFAAKIANVDEKDVKALLSQYLEPNEVESTLKRFALVKDACQKLLMSQAQGQLIPPSAWGAQTAQDQLADPRGSYLGKMASGISAHDFVDPITKEVENNVKDGNVVANLKRIVYQLESFVTTHKITIPEGMQLVRNILAAYSKIDTTKQSETVKNLRETPIPAWNSVLWGAPFDQNVLNRCK